MTGYYWEPHTSSIDFCEANYLHFGNVVEVHNTWSSLVGIASLGFIGAFWNNPTREVRTALAYAILILVGVGSTCLHLSLHRIFQASDELPMIYMNNCITFMILEYNAPLGKPKYPNLPSLLGLLALFQTIIYYRFQHNFIVFLATYSSGVFLIVILGSREMHIASRKRGPITWQLFHSSFIAYVCVGTPAWILDTVYCEVLHGVYASLSSNVVLLNGITVHVLWHFAAAFGTYCAISCASACRMEELEIPFRLTYLGGVVPVMVRTDVKTTLGKQQ